MCHYDFWTITIFTSLKLALKWSFFNYFVQIFGPSVARKFFFDDKPWQKINFRLFWIQQVQIVIGCHIYFQRNTRYTESSFWYKSIFSMYFLTFFHKLGFRIFQFSQWNYINTYNCLYLLDSEKSKVYFLSCFVVEKKFLATLGPKALDEKWPFLRLILGL